MDLRQPPLSARPSVKSLRGKVVRVPRKSLKSARKSNQERVQKCKGCRIKLIKKAVQLSFAIEVASVFVQCIRTKSLFNDFPF